jgi:hypothetical protein
MSEYNEVFKALHKTARDHGWALFQEKRGPEPDQPEAWLLKVVDVRRANFNFDYMEFVKDDDPPPLGVHVVDGAGAVDRVG